METRTKVILAAILLAVAALAFDWHLYIFDRPKYLIRESVEKCMAADGVKDDYQECRTKGYPDKHCEYFRALYIEKAYECRAAEAALTAEAYRRRAQ